MCYDIQTSLIALVINIVTSIVLFIVAKNKERDANVSNQLKAVALFFLFVGFMQFWDILFWSYDTTTKINCNSNK